MARNKYRQRIADALLQTELLSAGAVLIEGAKWCGKTRTAEQVARSIVYMQDQDMADNYLQMAETMPSLLLEGDEPHLVDEWQVAPNLWDAVRFAVDMRGGMGHFILTGSAVPPDDNDEKSPKLKRRHTGTDCGQAPILGSIHPRSRSWCESRRPDARCRDIGIPIRVNVLP